MKGGNKKGGKHHREREEREELLQRITSLERRLVEISKENESLRKSEEKYRFLVENINDVIFDLDVQGRITYISPSIERMSLYKAEEIQGHNFADFIHPQDLPMLENSFRETLSGVMEPAEFRVLDKDGREISVRTFSRPRFQDDQPAGLTGVLIDVTERKKMYEELEWQTKELQEKTIELEASRASFLNVVERNMDGMVVVDRRGIVRFANASACCFLERSRDELVGGQLGISIEPGDALELDILRLNGERGLAEMRVEETEWEGQKAFLAILRDITERKRAEELIKQSEASYRAIFDAAAEAIFVNDIQTGELLDVNRRASEFYGYTREELMRLDVRRDLSIEKEPYIRKNLLGKVKKAARGEPQIFEWMAKDKSGGAFWVEISLKRASIMGRDCMLSIVRDISERKRAEEALRASEVKYRLLYEYAGDAIYIFDKNMLITEMNRRACELAGYSREELLGRNIMEIGLIHPDDYRYVEAGVKRLMAGEPYVHGTFRGVKRDGSVIFLEVTAAPLLDKSGNIEAIINVGRDITERKRAEEALRASEEKFRRMAESTAVAIYILSGDKLIYVNPACERLTGYSKEELLQMNFWELVHPDFRELVTQRALARMRGEEVPTRYEFKILTKDGEERWGDFSPIPIQFEGRLAVLGTAIDITERKRAEEALRASEEKFRSLAESANAAVFIVSGNRLAYANPYTEEQTGYTREELLQMNFWDLLHPDFRELVTQRALARMRGEEVPNRYEFKILTKDGEERWADFAATLIEYEGSPAIIGIAYDVTERKLAEERLEKLNRCFLGLGVDPSQNIRKILHAGKDILGGTFMQYARLEKGQLHIFCSLQEMEEIMPLELTMKSVCYKVVSEGGSEPLVVEDFDRSDFADNAWLKRRGLKSCMSYPVRIMGKAVGCLTLYDIRARSYPADELDILGTLARAIAIEEERWAHEESIKDFIDVASHELYHPITIIKGYLEVLDTLGERMDEEARRVSLESIHRGCLRMEKLVYRLLDVTSIERGRLTLKKVKTEIKPLLEKAVMEMRERGVNNPITLALADDLPEVEVDEERIEELLVQLLDNAAIYSPPNEEIELKAERGEGELVFSVLDRGEGVPEEYREVIFERLYRVEEAKHHSKPGMGLGLYIAREIVDSHGGKIWHEHREGGGSIFRFTIPFS